MNPSSLRSEGSWYPPPPNRKSAFDTWDGAIRFTPTRRVGMNPHGPMGTRDEDSRAHEENLPFRVDLLNAISMPTPFGSRVHTRTVLAHTRPPKVDARSSH